MISNIGKRSCMIIYYLFVYNRKLNKKRIVPYNLFCEILTNSFQIEFEIICDWKLDLDYLESGQLLKNRYIKNICFS